MASTHPVIKASPNDSMPGTILLKGQSRIIGKLLDKGLIVPIIIIRSHFSNFFCKITELRLSGQCAIAETDTFKNNFKNFFYFDICVIV